MDIDNNINKNDNFDNNIIKNDNFNNNINKNDNFDNNIIKNDNFDNNIIKNDNFDNNIIKNDNFDNNIIKNDNFDIKSLDHWEIYKYNSSISITDKKLYNGNHTIMITNIKEDAFYEEPQYVISNDQIKHIINEIKKFITDNSLDDIISSIQNSMNISTASMIKKISTDINSNYILSFWIACHLITSKSSLQLMIIVNNEIYDTIYFTQNTEFTLYKYEIKPTSDITNVELYSFFPEKENSGYIFIYDINVLKYEKMISI
jgi:hypothetical protein